MKTEIISMNEVADNLEEVTFEELEERLELTDSCGVNTCQC
jgi:hypothetical protein